MRRGDSSCANGNSNFRSRQFGIQARSPSFGRCNGIARSIVLGSGSVQLPGIGARAAARWSRGPRLQGTMNCNAQ